MPYTLKRLQHLSEITPLINNPYNKPDTNNPEAKERFWEEYKQVDSLIRSKLEKFGDIDAFGKKEFSMGDPWNNNRQIGIIVNRRSQFDEALIKELWNTIQELPIDYMLVLEGEDEPGGGNFYICIRKGNDVVGYAPDKSMLKPFGFD